MEQQTGVYAEQQQDPGLLPGVFQAPMDEQLAESPPGTPNTDRAGRQHSMSSLSSVGPFNYINSPSVSNSLQCGSVTYDNVLTGSTTSLAAHLGSHGAAFPGSQGKVAHTATSGMASPADTQAVPSFSAGHTKDTNWPSTGLSDKFFTPYENSAFAGERPHDDHFFTPMNTILAGKAQRTPFTTRLERVTDTSTGEAGSGRPTGSGTSYDPLAGCGTTWGSAPSSSAGLPAGPASSSSPGSTCSPQQGQGAHTASTARTSCSTLDGLDVGGVEVEVDGVNDDEHPAGHDDDSEHVPEHSADSNQPAQDDVAVTGIAAAAAAVQQDSDSLVCRTVMQQQGLAEVQGFAGDSGTPARKACEVEESCCLVASPPQCAPQVAAPLPGAHDKSDTAQHPTPVLQHGGSLLGTCMDIDAAAGVAVTDVQLHASLASAAGEVTPYLLKRVHASVTPMGQGAGGLTSPGFVSSLDAMFADTTAGSQDQHTTHSLLHTAPSAVDAVASNSSAVVPPAPGLDAVSGIDIPDIVTESEPPIVAVTRQQENRRTSQRKSTNSMLASADQHRSRQKETAGRPTHAAAGAAARKAATPTQANTPPAKPAVKPRGGFGIDTSKVKASSQAAAILPLNKHSPAAAQHAANSKPVYASSKPSALPRAGYAASPSTAAAHRVSPGADTARPATARHHDGRTGYQSTGAATARRPSTAAAGTRPTMQPAKPWASSHRPATAAPANADSKLPKPADTATAAGTPNTAAAASAACKPAGKAAPGISATKLPIKQAAGLASATGSIKAVGSIKAAADRQTPGSAAAQGSQATAAVQQEPARPFIPKLNLVALCRAGDGSTPPAAAPGKLNFSARAGASPVSASPASAQHKPHPASARRHSNLGAARSPLNQPIMETADRAHPPAKALHGKHVPLMRGVKSVPAGKGQQVGAASHAGAGQPEQIAPAPSARIVATPRRQGRAATAVPSTARPANGTRAQPSMAARRKSAGSAAAAGLREHLPITNAAVQASSGAGSRPACPTASSMAKQRQHTASSQAASPPVCVRRSDAGEHDKQASASKTASTFANVGAGAAAPTANTAQARGQLTATTAAQHKCHQAAPTAWGRRASDVQKPLIQAGVKDSRRASATGTADANTPKLTSEQKTAANVAADSIDSNKEHSQQRNHPTHIELREGARQLDAAAVAAKERLNRRNAFQAPGAVAHKHKAAVSSCHAASPSAQDPPASGDSKGIKQTSSRFGRSSGSRASFGSQARTSSTGGAAASGAQPPLPMFATKPGLRSTNSTDMEREAYGLGTPLSPQMHVPVVICTPRTSGAGSAARPHRYSSDCEEGTHTQAAPAPGTESTAATLKPPVAAAAVNQMCTPGNRAQAVPSAASPPSFQTGFQLWGADVSQETPTLLNSARTRGRTPLTRKVLPPPTAAATVPGPLVQAAPAVAATDTTAKAQTAATTHIPVSDASAVADTSSPPGQLPAKLDWSALWAVTPTSSFRTDMGDPSPRSQTSAPNATSITSDTLLAGRSRSPSPAGPSLPPQLAGPDKEQVQQLSAPLLVLSEALVQQARSPSDTAATLSPSVCISPDTGAPGSSSSPVWPAADSKPSSAAGSMKPAWGAACMLSTVGKPMAKEAQRPHTKAEATVVAVSQANPLRLSMFEVHH